MAGIILFVGFSQMAPLIQPIDTKIYNLYIYTKRLEILFNGYYRNYFFSLIDEN
jgi:hypothetical protein